MDFETLYDLAGVNNYSLIIFFETIEKLDIADVFEMRVLKQFNTARKLIRKLKIKNIHNLKIKDLIEIIKSGHLFNIIKFAIQFLQIKIKPYSI